MYVANKQVHAANIHQLKVVRETLEESVKYVHTIKTPKRRYRHHSGIFIVNFRYILQLFLVFLMMTMSIHLLAGIVIFLVVCQKWKIKYFAYLFLLSVKFFS